MSKLYCFWQVKNSDLAVSHSLLISGFLNMLRKDLGHSKPAIVPRKQAHQLIMWGFKTISKLPELLKLN